MVRAGGRIISLSGLARTVRIRLEGCRWGRAGRVGDSIKAMNASLSASISCESSPGPSDRGDVLAFGRVPADGLDAEQPAASVNGGHVAIRSGCRADGPLVPEIVANSPAIVLGPAPTSTISASRWIGGPVYGRFPSEASS